MRLAKQQTSLTKKEEFWEEINSTGAYTDLVETMSRSTVGYTPEGRVVNFDQVDRFGHQAAGCFYTSKEFPWPQNNEKPYRPLIQINLTKLEEMGLTEGVENGGFNLGGGLVQAFELMEKSTSYEDWYFVRRIPKEAVSDQLVTSFQPFKKDLIQLSESYWPDYAGLFGEESKAFSIDRFAASCFRVPDALFESRDFWLHLEDEFPELYEEISDLTEEFEKESGSVDGHARRRDCNSFWFVRTIARAFSRNRGRYDVFRFRPWPSCP